jgi:hypothetical protein
MSDQSNQPSLDRFSPHVEEIFQVVIDANRVVEEYSSNPMDLFYRTGVHYSSESGAQNLAGLLYTEIFAPLSDE